MSVHLFIKILPSLPRKRDMLSTKGSSLQGIHDGELLAQRIHIFQHMYANTSAGHYVNNSSHDGAIISRIL